MTTQSTPPPPPDSDPPSSAPPPDSGGQPPVASGGSQRRRLLSNKMILGIGIGGAAVVAVIAIVAVLFATGVIGGGGGVNGGSGANPQDLILEDAPFVLVQNVATILETEFPDGIPQQMLRFQVFNMPDGIEVDLEDADEWKEEWGDVFADNMPGWMKESITLQEVNYAMMQGFGTGSESGLIISGNFDFEGIRGTLEDDKEDGGAGLKDGEYRDFEVWGG